ncbi:MAG TPA: CheR family methyltransferase [Anaerolineae bacterium]|nr:CheR family methyltransferase [Anaerolineae bacterium]
MSQPARARDVQATLFSPADAERFGEIVERHFGLFFPENRQSELQRGVLHAFATSTCQDLDDFYRLVEAEARSGSTTGLELERLVNALTVGETYFFRDAGQFDALYQAVLPELIERRRNVRTLRIWSAGCASGEEPYSIAMMLRVLLPDIDEWAITLLGTDVNAEALARARGAHFGDWAFREERARAWRDRFFQPVARPTGTLGMGKRWALAPEVRRLVTFRRLNLAGDHYPSLDTNTAFMDLILCRNVTIYFSEAATRRVIARFHEALGQDAWLVVGHSEPSPANYARFEPRNFPGAVLYRRVQHDPAPCLWPPAPPSRSRAAPPLPTIRARAQEPRVTDPVGEVRAAVDHARELLEYGHSEQACNVLEKVLSPGDGPPALARDVYTLLGQAHADRGNLQTAEEWCRRATAADRLALDAYYTLALVLQHQGRIDEAIDAMKKVVYIDRHSILGHFGLANLYHSRRQEIQAQKAMRNARRLLEHKPPGEVIPGSGGITAGSLYEAATRAYEAKESDERSHQALTRR